MAYESLKSAVTAVITENGNNEITGAILKALINDNLIPQLGAGHFKGFANTSTNPGTPETELFYIASQTGTFTNFGGLEVTKAMTILQYIGSSWVKLEAKVGDQFLGAFNPYTQSPALSDGTGVNGDYYIAEKSGVFNAGNGNILISKGDVVKHDGTNWLKAIDNNQNSIDNLINSLAPYFGKKIGESVATTQVSPTWQNEISTFSAWGCGIGQQPEFNAVKLWIRGFNPSEPVTMVNVRIRQNDYNGTILAQKTVNLDNINGEELVVFLDETINTSDNLWIEYLTDGRIGRYSGSDSSANTAGVSTRYNTSKSLTATVGSSVTSGQTRPFYVELFNATKELIFTQEALTYLEDTLQIDSSLAILFEEILNYDSLSSVITPTFTTGQARGNPFAGWGADFNKVGVSFNGLRMRNVRRSTSTPEAEKWQYIKVWVKNVRSDATPVAVSNFVKIDKESNTLDEIIIPLTDPSTGNIITLDDSSFSGSTYFIGYLFYNEDKAIAYGGETLGSQSNYAGTSYYSTNLTDTTWSTYSGNPAVPFEHLILTGAEIGKTLVELADIKSRLTSLENSVDDVPRIILPDHFDATVGYRQQLFYRGMIEDIDPFKYNIKITGNVGGKQYPRYYDFTPTTAGTYTFTITLYNREGVQVTTASCNVIVSATGTSPSTLKRILCVGDSLTSGGLWTGELQRMLAQSGGSPSGLNLNNIEFIGTVGSGDNKYEGYGGKTWGWYITETTSPDVDFTVASHDKDSSDLVSIWADSNGNEWRLEAVTNSTMLVFSRYEHTANAPSSGTLTHVSGANNTGTITYTAVENNSGTAVNKFWNSATDQLDFTNYVGINGFVDIDYVCVLLTWNGMGPDRSTAADHSGLIADAKVFVDKLHQQYPNAKVKLMGIQLPSIDGGLPQNYGDGNSNYGNYYGLARTVFGLNLAYQEWANESAYSSFVEFVNVSAQFDTLYNMPKDQRAVNIRNSTDTEQAGTNGVHPTTEGYYQIADAIFKTMNKEF